MRTRPTGLLLPCALVAVYAFVAMTGCAATGKSHLLVDSPRAQVFESMGDHGRTITTSSRDAQEYFDQGLAWMLAFNHDEAIRSFARAAQLDPACAMAWWGIALCEGPNYNDPVMTPERTAAAWRALGEARARIDNTTPLERELIEALSLRYSRRHRKDRSRLEEAYAEAMAEVQAAHPDDSLVATLYAEAMMVRRPWKLYTADGEAEGDTPEIVAMLEHAMELDPDNPGANHLYIHAVEPSRDPGRGLAAADRLGGQVPSAGHLIHMPSHIYIQVGQWGKSIEHNARAMAADERYRSLAPDQGIQHMYMVHNAHMLAYSAMMAGREAEAMAAARAMWENVPLEVLEAVAPYVDLWMTSVYDVQKRFGRWDAILDEPAPPAFLPITTAGWHAHRAVAHAAKHEFAEAEREQEAFLQARAAIPEESVFGGDPARRILLVSERFIAGEIALQRGEWDRAAELLEEAVDFEDDLSYGEPPQWLQPTRHTLGAVYLMAKRFRDAENVYREDLERWAGNGWSLQGLGRALEEQGRLEEAAEVVERYRVAWGGADESTSTSCKCIPNP